MRYHAPVEDQFDTLEEAIKRARSDYETDQAYPTEITDQSGKIVISRFAISELLAGRPVSVGMTDNGQQFTIS
jgi:hypothetical protein